MNMPFAICLEHGNKRQGYAIVLKTLGWHIQIKYHWWMYRDFMVGWLKDN